MADIRTFDINLLKVLDALLDERNVSRAADRLHLTQPTVSGALARLRDAFDDPLFVRRQRGVLPTPRALALAGPVKAALAEVEAVLSPEAFDPRTSDRTITIAATDYAQHTLVRPLVAVLAREAPEMRLATVSVEPARLKHDLDLGLVDLWLTLPAVAPPALRHRVLYEERYVCVVRAEHPLAGARMSLDDFCAHRHLVVSPDGGGFEGAVDAALRKMGRSRTVSVSSVSFAVVPDIVRATDLVAVLPERLVRDDPGLRPIRLPLAIEGFTLIAAWHERFHHEPAHVWTRERIARIAKGLL